MDEEIKGFSEAINSTQGLQTEADVKDYIDYAVAPLWKYFRLETDGFTDKLTANVKELVEANDDIPWLIIFEWWMPLAIKRGRINVVNWLIETSSIVECEVALKSRLAKYLVIPSEMTAWYPLWGTGERNVVPDPACDVTGNPTLDCHMLEMHISLCEWLQVGDDYQFSYENERGEILGGFNRREYMNGTRAFLESNVDDGHGVKLFRLYQITKALLYEELLDAVRSNDQENFSRSYLLLKQMLEYATLLDPTCLTPEQRITLVNAANPEELLKTYLLFYKVDEALLNVMLNQG